MRTISRLAVATTLVVIALSVLASAAEPQRRSPARGQTYSTREIAQRATRSLVVVLNLDKNGEVLSLGSGFVFRSGVVATNFHVIDGASRILVRRSGQDESFRASIIKVSASFDLALLQVDGLAAPPLAIGQDSTVEVGDTVFAVGNPKGLEATFSDGLVSARRTVDGIAMLQITAPISPGSSGGPILDRQGQVVGVAVGKIEGGDLLNFAIPISNLLRLEAVTSDVAADTATRGPVTPAASDQSLADLCTQFRNLALRKRSAIEVNRAYSGATLISRVEINGNWLLIETTSASTDPPVLFELEFLLSEVTVVKEVEGGLVALTDGDKVRTKITSGPASDRYLADGAVIPAQDKTSAQLMISTLESMVRIAKGNPAGDARERSGPSVESTVEFIRSQIAMHGHSKRAWTGDSGIRFAEETRTRSFDVRGGLVTLETEVVLTALNGSFAGKSGSPAIVRQSFRLVDMGAASSEISDERGTFIVIGSSGGRPVTKTFELRGNVETTMVVVAHIPFASDDARPRVVKALNYLIDLAHDRKEPEPF